MALTKRNGKTATAARGVPAFAAPASVLCLDLETGNAPQAAIDLADRVWKAPSNLRDPAKIDLARYQAQAKHREKSALLDGAPIACVGAVVPMGATVFNGMDSVPYQIDRDVQAVGCGNEREMLLALREWLDKMTTQETLLVVFNGIEFDLPKLRVRYVAHKMSLPQVLRPAASSDGPQQPVYDVMRMFTRFYTVERHGQPYISQDEVCARLELPRFDCGITGADVPGLIERKEYSVVLKKCRIDSVQLWMAYGRLSSTAEGLT